MEPKLSSPQPPNLMTRNASHDESTDLPERLKRIFNAGKPVEPLVSSDIDELNESEREMLGDLNYFPEANEVDIDNKNLKNMS